MNAAFFARAFDLPDGRIITSCLECGTPLWGTGHLCIGAEWREFERALFALYEEEGT